jgi:enoyl-CoA hydratase/carnithine racemase
MSGFRTLQLEREGAVARITLDRPETRNAYDMAMRDDLFAALSLVRADPSLRALVIRGNGAAFCSGGDIREFGSAPSPIVARDVRLRRDNWALLRSLPQPTIAAMHGHAAGSGLELALLCDFRIAARGATLSLPESRLGMIPGVVGTQTLPRLAGVGRALEMVLTGTAIDARRALRIGILGAVVPAPKLREEADRLAARLAKLDSEAVSAVKRLIWSSCDRTLDQGLAAERVVAARICELHKGKGK